MGTRINSASYPWLRCSCRESGLGPGTQGWVKNIFFNDSQGRSFRYKQLRSKCTNSGRMTVKAARSPLALREVSLAQRPQGAKGPSTWPGRVWNRLSVALSVTCGVPCGRIVLTFFGGGVATSPPSHTRCRGRPHGALRAAGFKDPPPPSTCQLSLSETPGHGTP